MSSNFAYNLGSGGTTTSGLLSKSGNDDETYTAAAVLSEFTGNGTFGLSASTFTQTLLGNSGGNTSATQVTDAQLTGTVTYTYTEALPTPEPGYFVILFLASAVLIGMKQRGHIFSRSAK